MRVRATLSSSSEKAFYIDVIVLTKDIEPPAVASHPSTPLSLS